MVEHGFAIGNGLNGLGIQCRAYANYALEISIID